MYACTMYVCAASLSLSLSPHQHAQQVADGANVHDDIADEWAPRDAKLVRKGDDRHHDAHDKRARP
jgi:hypothetical protein